MNNWLADVAAQRGACVAECGVQRGGNGLDAGDPSECKQRGDQRVFHQILTFFPVHQILNFDIQLEKYRVHFEVPPRQLSCGCRKYAQFAL